MTPEQKAEELIERFEVQLNFEGYVREDAKQCALICVDEIIEELKLFNYKLTPLLAERIRYYKGVRKELNNL